MDIEQEFRDLRQRVGDLEGVIGALNGQVGQIQPDVMNLGAVMRTRFDTCDGTLQKALARLDLMNTQIWSLRDDMPVFIADAIRLSRKQA